MCELEGIFSVRSFGAVPDGSSDNTQAFQKALDEAGKTGGIVWAGPGKYRFEGHLHIPVGVTLQGTFGSVPAHNGHRDAGLPKPGDFGTVLMPTADKGNEGGEPFLTLSTNATVKGLLIWYPDQTDASDPHPYPWTIAMRGKNPAVIDTELLNPYNAIDATGNERHMIKGVYGQPLRRGIFINAIYDIGRVEDVHFNPWWSMSPAVKTFMEREGQAFIIGRTDWEYMINCFSIFYKEGFVFDDFGQGPGNAVLTQCGHDIAPVTVRIKKLQPHAGVSFNNCQFMGDFVVEESNRGPVRLNGCGFWGVGHASATNPGTQSNLHLNGTGHVILNGCHFTGWDQNPDAKDRPSPSIDIACRSASITACDFIDAKPCHIRVRSSVEDCAIVSNKFSGGPKILVEEGARAQIGFNLSTGQREQPKFSIPG